SPWSFSASSRSALSPFGSSTERPSKRERTSEPAPVLNRAHKPMPRRHVAPRRLPGSTICGRFRVKALTGWRWSRYQSVRSLLPDRYPKGVLMLRRALIFTFAAAIITIGSSSSAAAVTHVERSAQGATAQSDIVALVNAYRANNELQAVSQNGALTAAAAWMAGDMAAKNYIGHVSSDGRSPTQRM